MSKISEDILPEIAAGAAGAAPWEPSEAPVRRNGYATAALVCALLTAGLGWVPVLGWVLWLSAIALSLIGLTRAPRWQAYVALVLTAAVTVEALLFAMVGSRAVHSFFSFMAGY
ncbi:MAG: hypothetical protein K2I51_05755 [Muribaculaceae bacterium]|nr:hypothetical protein [Muribaculaceae bacterium]